MKTDQPKPTGEVTELRTHSKSLTKEEVELMNLHSETVDRLTKPTGEWTRQDVEKLLRMFTTTPELITSVQDAHNAALDAEKLRGDMGWQTVEQYKQQLAAERERHDDLQRSVMDLSHPNCKDLLQQLAAERELLEQGITAGADWDWHNRVKAALAKVKVANTQCKTIAALMQDAEQQLVAEREKREQWTINSNTNLQIAERNAQINDSLREQLDDERKRYELALSDSQHRGELLDAAQKQLSAEREESKRLREGWARDEDLLDAERENAKTLTDAIQKHNDWIENNDDVQMRCYIIDAPAKVKEDLK